MKIAWLVPGFSSDERDWCIPALLDLARVMATRHDLHVFALRYPYRRDRYSVFGATVHAIGGAHRGRWTLPGIWQAMLRAVAREQRRAPFDALHAFWVYEPGLLATWLKRQLGVRTVISFAGGEVIHLPAIAYGYGGRRWLMRVMRWALPQIDVVTAGSRLLLDHARKRFKLPDERWAFAPLGVDLDLFSPGNPVPRTGARTILNVGSLQPVKGQATLIRAFRFVVDREPQARLLILGAGPLRQELEALAHELNLDERVTLAGDVPHEQLPGLHRAAALFVQASLHEAQGMAVLEAAASGLPIVGTAVGALADLAPDAAVVSPPDDPIRLAQAILSVTHDPARCEALRAAARARVEEVYSLSAAADRFERLYRA
ncbi:MAG TPA: glycosyltransferase family 4 protein [Anaerolineae bacterium]|nr:glycosyltransferase family 4 protein [Anaerolineae bacterium]